MTGPRFAEIAGTLFTGMLVRQASREVAKFIPFFGSIASGALAGAATFALGKRPATTSAPCTKATRRRPKS